ncbi:hypothetical protein LCGC14_2972750, partial [marine sediment metagenome]
DMLMKKWSYDSEKKNVLKRVFELEQE